MSQDIFDVIDPDISGTELAGILNDFKDAMVSGMSGTARPTELDPGGGWIDTTNDPTTWSYKIWTGSADVEVFEIDLVNSSASVSLAVDSFIVRRVSADTVGAIMNLVKRRIASSGQVLSGDVVGEVRMVGRTDAGADPVVAKIIYTADENQTASAYGGTLSFYSTPVGTNTLTEHMRLITGLVETIVPHKTNAQILVSQNVATAATIAQLSGAKVVVEMTGATATSIQGINSAHDSKVVTVHNRSSANVTLEHQDLGAAAADRLSLPESRDIVLVPQDSATFFYCTADTRWKVQYASSRFQGFQNETFFATIGEFDAPLTVSKVRVTAHSRKTSFDKLQGDGVSRVLDVSGSIFSWGFNNQGAIGDGSVTTRNSPSAALGGFKFVEVLGYRPGGIGGDSTIALTDSGLAYAWGNNPQGQLGVGDVTSRSSPVAVVGGFRFKSLYAAGSTVHGLSLDGTPYAWGYNAFGELGVGDVVSRSSPVAVAGSLKFSKMAQSGNGSTYGIAFDGSLFAWGYNSAGQLGLGDTTDRSSPVAVTGGLKFIDVFAIPSAVFAIADTGLLYAWGVNLNGQLGVGDVTNRSAPTLVPGGLLFRDIFGDLNGIVESVFGITTTDVMYGWGGNHRGQLGVGDVVPRSSPVAVLGGLLFEKGMYKLDSAYGLTTDRSLYAWGFNDVGQLGVGDQTPRSSPVAVSGGLSFQDINVTSYDASATAHGLTYNGRLYGWGYNGSGQVGDSTVLDRSAPVGLSGGLSLRSQDDFTTVLDIPVVGGDTYALQLGSGPCFFGNKPIGLDIQKVEITYVE